jgi:penicillin amidase
LYLAWESALLQAVAAASVPADLVGEVTARSRSALVGTLVNPSRTWFGGDVVKARDAMLLASLTTAAEKARSAAPRAVTFAHALAVTDAARARFNIGPFRASGYSDTVLAQTTSRSGRAVGPSFRAIFDLTVWDRSVATQAPGQSEWPASVHFSDLAKVWAAGEYFPLPFTESAVEAATESTLVLVPR